ncbi:MAG: Hsp33 family molecular chaperone HslO [Zoogloeaceae bacterium]|jgi:molecular chaperone Hsp33|nr:Hsp33 family molecular chaperone HslO [Zoogloeaceae bacterium]
MLTRFLFPELAISGAVVSLDVCWRELALGRGWSPVVLRLMGELSAVATLLAGQGKNAGRLTFQLKGDGSPDEKIARLVVDCQADETGALQLRGMAKAQVPAGFAGDAAALLTGGQLIMSLDLPEMKQPWQSVIPTQGRTLSDIFSHYMQQSAQREAAFFLAADARNAAGLWLQKMPEADALDADGFARLAQLAATLKDVELLTLPAETLLSRLFHEETCRVFAGQPVSFDRHEDWEKARGIVRSLGEAAAQQILDDEGEITLFDELSNQRYRFSPEAVAAIFAAPLQ